MSKSDAIGFWLYGGGGIIVYSVGYMFGVAMGALIFGCLVFAIGVLALYLDVRND